MEIFISRSGNLETKTMHYQIAGQDRTSIHTYRPGHEDEAPCTSRVIEQNGDEFISSIDENGLYVRKEKIKGKMRVTEINQRGLVLYKELFGKPGEPDLSKISLNIESIKLYKDLPPDLKETCKGIIKILSDMAYKALK
ncbi:hypothetical protein IJ541_10435 [bacterium]|nr:hypothetical protein [bacterium]